MQNIIHLLALVRIESPWAPDRVDKVIDGYAACIRQGGGYVIDIEAPQIMVCLADANFALESLHALMSEGELHGFGVACGLVQAIRASNRIPRNPNDFTERTLETVIELAGSASRQQVAISNKLMSLLELAVPYYAHWFDSGAEVPGREISRVRQLMILRGERLPRYQGLLRVLPSQAPLQAPPRAGASN